MKIGNQSFIQMNNAPTSHQKGKQLTAISLGLLAALGTTATVAQADDPTTDNLTSGNIAEYTQYNNDSADKQAQVPVQPVVNNSYNYNYNLQLINQRSNELYQQILMHHNAQLTRSFNANQVLNQQKVIHQALAPQMLELPVSSGTNQIKHRRALFLVELQIIMTLYILFRNFVPLLKDKRKSKSRSLGVTSQAHKAKISHVTITFRDIYGDQDGLMTPNPVTKSGVSTKAYAVTAPDNWALVRLDGAITNRIKFNYRDGNQMLSVISVYKGLTYKYNQATKTLEFTHGSLDNIDSRPFLDKENVPKGIPISQITSITFAHSVQINGSNLLRSMFTHDSYLQSINVKGSMIKRRPVTKNVKRNPPNIHVHRQAQDLLSDHRTSHQAETNALNELSMIIGGLDDGQHRQDN